MGRPLSAPGLIYPGQFVPPTPSPKRPTAPARRHAIAVKASVSENAGAFLVKLAMPHASPGSLIVSAHGQRLSVRTASGLRKRITLPPDADTDFACARYLNGVLCIYVSKSDHVETVGTKRIVVY